MKIQHTHTFAGTEMAQRIEKTSIQTTANAKQPRNAQVKTFAHVIQSQRIALHREMKMPQKRNAMHGCVELLLFLLLLLLSQDVLHTNHDCLLIRRASQQLAVVFRHHPM